MIRSPEAADDLELIVEFVARGSPRYGRQVASDVLAAVERVATFPGSGRVVPEIDAPDIREVSSSITGSSTESGRTPSTSPRSSTARGTC